MSVLLWLWNPAAALAEDDPPPGRERMAVFAADARVSLPRFKADSSLAEDLGVTVENLPARGFGVGVGAHVYPVRSSRMALGVGGEWMSSRRSRTLEPTVEGGAEGPTVTTRFSTIAPQVSLNFGGRDGWSYLSGGLGWSKFTVERAGTTAAAADPAPPRQRTIHYGAGARWFTTEHVAVSLDLRFYSVSAREATVSRPGVPSMRLMVFSAGVGFK